MIEHYAGKLPLWLAPTQCAIATITSEVDEYAEELYNELKEKGLRPILDQRNEKISYKVREHSTSKVPVIFVIGKSEAEEKTVSIRRLGSPKTESQKADQAIADLIKEAKTPF